MKKLFLILSALFALSSCASNNLPPVTEERLNEMLVEIVERESRIITEEESDKIIENKKEGYIYFHANGCTYLMDINKISPYHYIRVLYKGEDADVPNYIYVRYARPTKENMRCIKKIRKEVVRMPVDDVIGTDGIEDGYYGAQSGYEFTLNTTVKIGGEEYEVMFVDVDEGLIERSEQ